MTDRLKQIWL